MTEKELLDKLKKRFEANPERHKEIDLEMVMKRLDANPEKLKALMEMERTGGEPDVVGIDSTSGEIIFADCSPETPAGRRNCCYDLEGQQKREKKGIHPEGNAVSMSKSMGIQLMTEEEYYKLQELFSFDLRTSSWLKTEDSVRKLGGAIFGDKRFGRTFIYHNGADSFYSSRGFRGTLRV